MSTKQNTKKRKKRALEKRLLKNSTLIFIDKNGTINFRQPWGEWFYFSKPLSRPEDVYMDPLNATCL